VLDSGRSGVQNETGPGCHQTRPMLGGKEVPHMVLITLGITATVVIALTITVTVRVERRRRRSK
jgi:hypothetical protein